MRHAACRSLSRTACHSNSHAVQPGTDRVALADRANSAHQNKECGLERVVDVVRVSQKPSANGQNHRAVSLDQNAKRLRRNIPPAGSEKLQELTILPAGQRARLEKRHERLRLERHHGLHRDSS